MSSIKSIFKGDKIIWIVIFTLLTISILSVYSSIATLAFRYKGGDTEAYLWSHLRGILLGLVALYLMYRIPYGWLYNFYKIILVFAFILLVFTFFSGTSEHGAKRWAQVGFIRLQASDIVRFALVVYVSRVLSVSQDSEGSRTEALKKLFWVILIAVAMIVPYNLSTGILLYIVSMILLYLGGIDLKRIGRITLIIIAATTIFIAIVPDKYVNSREGTCYNRTKNFFVGDEEDPQVVLAKSAIATSNIIGKGPGNSDVKYQLENASTDFIYAIIIEELGSFMAVLVLVSYLIILYRTAIIVKNMSKTFAGFLVIGLTLNIVFQAIINMAVAVNIMPVTGQPLPLVSWGGTSMVITLGSLGVILNISKKFQEDQLAEQTVVS